MKRRRKELGALTAKAHDLATFVAGISTVLRQEAELAFSGQTVYVKPKNTARPFSGTWPSWEDLRALLAEIEATKQRIAELEQRRKELGV